MLRSPGPARALLTEVHYARLSYCPERDQRRSAVPEVRASRRAVHRQLRRKACRQTRKGGDIGRRHDQRPVVMFEFPDIEAIHAFWNSPDYTPIKKLREGIATLNIWAFAGA